MAVAGANVHDTKLLRPTLENIVVARPEGVQNLCLDKGYDNPTGHGTVAAFRYCPHIRRIGEEKLDQWGEKTFPITGALMMPEFRIQSEMSISAIESLEEYFREGGSSIVQAAFRHTYFVHPEAVRNKSPYFPKRARRSREHYPGIDKGKKATWKAGDGRKITLDDNSRAQMAWEKYTGHKLARKSGYGVRHIWGNTHNPEAFTAGWNLCYMPFWAGMLTEEQHPHPKLQRAIRQASWDLYFAGNPEREPPDFVSNPGIDLKGLLEGNPLLVLSAESIKGDPPSVRKGLQNTTLPITLDPRDSEDFRAALLRAKEAWIEVSYQDGHREVRRWNATRMKSTSNVIGNLRSRPEFRAKYWQNNGIVSVRVSIEQPDSRRR